MRPIAPTSFTENIMKHVLQIYLCSYNLSFVTYVESKLSIIVHEELHSVCKRVLHHDAAKWLKTFTSLQLSKALTEIKTGGLK